MTLKPWDQVVEPREDFREGRPLDASEFAVYLDKARERMAPTTTLPPSSMWDKAL